jgi:uncharacterized membrane protein YfcA
LLATALVSGLLAYLGAMVGLVLGQFRLPLLVLALGSAPAAAASNLAISSLGAFTGAWAHAAERRVDLRLVLSIGLPSAIAAFASSRTLARVDAWWIELAIGGTLMLSALPIAARAWRGEVSAPARGERADDAGAAPPAHDTPSRTAAAGPATDEALDLRWLPVEILVGVVLGGLSGVVGLLLGTLRLPAMLRLGVTPPIAAGSNMAIGFVTGVGGALGALGSGRISGLALLVVGGATVVGAYAGARRTKQIPTRTHLALIAAVLFVVGLWLLGRGSWL